MDAALHSRVEPGVAHGISESLADTSRVKERPPELVTEHRGGVAGVLVMARSFVSLGRTVSTVSNAVVMFSGRPRVVAMFMVCRMVVLGTRCSHDAFGPPSGLPPGHSPAASISKSLDNHDTTQHVHAADERELACTRRKVNRDRLIQR